MRIWVDAQLSPALAIWINTTLGFDCSSLKSLGLRDATDRQIYEKASLEESVIILTKDSDFLNLLDQFGDPPKIIWITCGNTSNDFLKEVLSVQLPIAIELLLSGEVLIEIG